MAEYYYGVGSKVPFPVGYTTIASCSRDGVDYTVAGSIAATGGGHYWWTATNADLTAHVIHLVLSGGGMPNADMIITTEQDYTAARAGYLTSDLATIQSGVTSNGTAIADVPAGVWGVTTRTLSSFGTLAADTATAVWAVLTAASMTLHSIGEALIPFLDAYTTTRGELLDHLNADIDSRYAGTPPSANDIALAVNAAHAGDAMTLTTDYDPAKAAATTGDITAAATTINTHTDDALSDVNTALAGLALEATAQSILTRVRSLTISITNVTSPLPPSLSYHWIQGDTYEIAVDIPGAPEGDYWCTVRDLADQIVYSRAVVRDGDHFSLTLIAPETSIYTWDFEILVDGTVCDTVVHGTISTIVDVTRDNRGTIV